MMTSFGLILSLIATECLVFVFALSPNHSLDRTSHHGGNWGRRGFLEVSSACLLSSSCATTTLLNPRPVLALEQSLSDQFSTRARAEYTNSITASRDTNVSPQEAYDSILRYLPPNKGSESNKVALDVGAGAGLSTSYLYSELGYKEIDAVDWSGDAWRSNVIQTPETVRFYEYDDDSFFDLVVAANNKKVSDGNDNEYRKYDIICYNFAINPSKAVRIARTYLKETGVLFAPVNDRPEYWYKQTYFTLDAKGQILAKSEADVGAWSVQFQPDVTSETCTGIWCGETNGFFAKRKSRGNFR